MKKTLWFDAKVETPKRVGYYETRCSCNFWKGPAFWDGKAWQIDHTEKGGCSFGQACDDWRGLTKETK